MYIYIYKSIVTSPILRCVPAAQGENHAATLDYVYTYTHIWTNTYIYICIFTYTFINTHLVRMASAQHVALQVTQEHQTTYTYIYRHIQPFIYTYVYTYTDTRT